MAKKTKRPSARPRPGGAAAAKRPAPARDPLALTGIDAATSSLDEAPLRIPNDEFEDSDELDEVASGEPPVPVKQPVGAVRRQATRVAPAQREAIARRPGRQVRSGTQAAIFEPLPADDDAIPFDRVPYVPADLRRVAIIAGIMVAIIIVAAIIVSATVK